MLNSPSSKDVCTLLDGLDDSQRNAIFHRQGPALVVAGPGSGKTTVILGRVWHLISRCQVPPEQILVLTFTKAAALSLQSRLLSFLGQDGVPVSFGTFHSFFYQILRQYGSYKDFNIITTKEKQGILQELGISDEGMRRDILRAFSCYLNNAEADLKSALPIEFPEEEFDILLNKYLSILEKEKMIDFDQMAELTLQLLRDKPEVLSTLRQKYPCVLVDEFQDTNYAQYEILKLLAEKSNNLFVVGDDDQAIYSFRGSSPDIMKRFLEEYAYVRTYYLTINYRSEVKIVKDAGKLIAQNKKRMTKQIKAYSKAEGEVCYKNFETSKEEYKYVADRVREFSHAFPWEKMAVIGRTNRQLENLAEVLKVTDIPYTMEGKKVMKTGGVRRDLEDLISYILGDKNKGRLWLTISENRQREAEFWINKAPRLFMNHLISGTGYMAYLKEQEDFEQRNQELDGYVSVSAQYKSMKAFYEFLCCVERDESKGNGGVRLLTMHGAKGLEFSCVVLIDINEGIIPGRQCITQQQVEEERRMLYVGMTRAKKILDVCYLKGTKEHPRFVSRFLNPLIKECED